MSDNIQLISSNLALIKTEPHRPETQSNQQTVKSDTFAPDLQQNELNSHDLFFISSPLVFAHSPPKIGHLLPQIHSSQNKSYNFQWPNMPHLNLSEGFDQKEFQDPHSDVSTPSSPMYSLDESEFSTHSQSTSNSPSIFSQLQNYNEALPVDPFLALTTHHRNELTRLNQRAEELNYVCTQKSHEAQEEEALALQEFARRESAWIEEQERLQQLRAFTRRTRIKKEDEDYTASDDYTPPRRRRGRPPTSAKRSNIAAPRPLTGSRRTKLPIRAVEVLREAFLSLLPSPFLDEKGKMELMQRTGLGQKQVADWFTNTRKRSYKYFVNMLIEARCNIVDQPRGAVCMCTGPIKHSWEDLFQ